MATQEQAQTGLTHNTEFVRAPDGERIFVQRWRPASGPLHAALVLSHGLAEHAGNYGPFVEYFASRGAAIYAQDHRGFGRSEGRRGHVPLYERYVKDLLPLVRRAREENPGLPLVLVGHSMGGTIALLFTLRYPELLTCAVYSAPALIVSLRVPVWRRGLARAMSRLYPTYTNTSITNPAYLTHDPEMQRETMADTLRHNHVTARLWIEMFRRGPIEVFSRLGELRVPFLILHGAEDPLVPVEASRRVYEGATAAPARDILIYEGMRHEMFRETERARVFADVAAWLRSRGVEVEE